MSHRGRHWKRDGSTQLPREWAIPSPEGVQAQEHTENKYHDHAKDIYESAYDAEGDDEMYEDDYDYEEFEEEYEDDYDYEEYEEEEDEEEQLFPKHWTELNRDDLWHILGCSKYFEMDRPVPKDEAWDRLRKTYNAIVGKDISSLPLNDSSRRGRSLGGFQVSVEARVTNDRGRGVFATEPISKGSLVWSTEYTATFPNPTSYRQFLFALSPDLACECIPWSYIQKRNLSNGKGNVNEGEEVFQISLDLDIGALINGGMPNDEFKEEAIDEYANVGCVETGMEGGYREKYSAFRDIDAKEEIQVDYGEFADIDAWWDFGLGCTLCDVHSHYDE